MKKLLVMAVVFGMVVSCKNDAKTPEQFTEQAPKTIAPLTDDILETAVIYEVNIRQYSPEGSFVAFTKDIPQLKQLGVKVIWVMPVFPISETKRKATNGKFTSELPEEERAKYLGSYYAVTDFTKINPEFGTIEDFRELVKTAHDNDIYVILDWVPNHTGWDHVWIKEHPEYYSKNEAGDIIHPEGTDWTDVADLNYDNQDMRKEMIADMLYWIEKENIDGFRCDVAGGVPIDFWEQAIPQLREKKPLFMLAEASEAELLKDDLFDMCYGWGFHHLMKDLAQGKKTLKDFDAYFEKRFTDYGDDDILMNFVTNHDENSWSGTIKEHMGDASGLMTVLNYAVPGMPLVYSGQEYGLNHRLKFFEKDSIPKTKGDEWLLLEKLGQLKNTNVALNGGKQKADFKIETTSNASVLKFVREKDGVKLTFIGNVSNTQQSQKQLLEGSFRDAFSNADETYQADDTVTLKPWEYKLLIQ